MTQIRSKVGRGGFRPGTRHCPPVHPQGKAGFAWFEILVVVAVIAMLAFLLGPILFRSHEAAYRTQCSSNLRQLYNFALSFSNKKGNGAYPIAPTKDPRAHESLNLLLALEPDMPSKMFLCPAGEAREAMVDASGKYTLEADNLSYSWVSKPMTNITTGRALSSDKYIEGCCDDDVQGHDGHKGGMNVLMTDNSVVFIEQSDLPKDTWLPAGLTR